MNIRPASQPGASAPLLLTVKRPPLLEVPVAGQYDDCTPQCFTSALVRTPVHRRLFRGPGNSLQPSDADALCHPSTLGQVEDAPGRQTGRESVDQWLDVMESCTRSCSSSSSSSTCWDISTGDTAAAMSCGSAGLEAPGLSVPANEEAAPCTLMADLPPPAFVVLGLLSKP